MTDVDYKCIKNCACDGTIREETFTRRGSFIETMLSPSFSFKINENLRIENENLRIENEKLRIENENLKSKSFCCFPFLNKYY